MSIFLPSGVRGWSYNQKRPKMMRRQIVTGSSLRSVGVLVLIELGGLSHSLPGKRVSHVHSPAIKYFLKVQMKRSAVLYMCT